MDENFDLLEISFKQDSLIFISDGLPEATNSEGDLIGYDPVYNCIKQNGHLCIRTKESSFGIGIFVARGYTKSR